MTARSTRSQQSTIQPYEGMPMFTEGSLCSPLRWFGGNKFRAVGSIQAFTVRTRVPGSHPSKPGPNN